MNKYFYRIFGHCESFSDLAEKITAFQKFYFPEKDWSDICCCLKQYQKEKTFSDEQRKEWQLNLKIGDLVQTDISYTLDSWAAIFSIKHIEEDPLEGRIAVCICKRGRRDMFDLNGESYWEEKVVNDDLLRIPVRELFPCDEQNLRL